MRLVSYNILDGGEGRADPLAEVILAQRPDIVVLIEANDQSVLQRIASRLEMDFIHGQGRKGAAAILSRWPIRETINHGAIKPRLTRTLLEAAVIEPGMTPWVVGAVHLHAHARELDEVQREEELRDLLDAFARHRAAGTPHLIAGDFNSNSPGQRIDPEKCKPSTRQEWQENGGHIPRRIVQKMLDAGYVDSLEAAIGDGAATAGSFSTLHPGQRVDYIFAHGFDKRQIRSAWIEQDRLAQFASDHFPIGAEIVSA